MVGLEERYRAGLRKGSTETGFLKKESRERRERRERREVYCYSGITVLACTTNVHWPVYGSTRYPLSPSALGHPWRPVL